MNSWALGRSNTVRIVYMSASGPSNPRHAVGTVHDVDDEGLVTIVDGRGVFHSVHISRIRRVVVVDESEIAREIRRRAASALRAAGDALADEVLGGRQKDAARLVALAADTFPALVGATS